MIDWVLDIMALIMYCHLVHCADNNQWHSFVFGLVFIPALMVFVYYRHAIEVFIAGFSAW